MSRENSGIAPEYLAAPVPLRNLVGGTELKSHLGRWRLDRFGADAAEDLTIENASHRPTDEMLAAARDRANAPRSLTSWMMGDPSPGMSALDKRRIKEIYYGQAL